MGKDHKGKVACHFHFLYIQTWQPKLALNTGIVHSAAKAVLQERRKWPGFFQGRQRELNARTVKALEGTDILLVCGC